MAEVIWREKDGENWTVESAGSKPSGYVHPLALKALEELELPTAGLVSKSTESFLDQNIDLAITVCDHAKEVCPVLPGVKQTLHWPFDDPADAEGSESEKLVVFRRVRDEIQQAINGYLAMNDKSRPKVDQIHADAEKLIKLALAEDIGFSNLAKGVDCTTQSIVPKEAMASAAFVSREYGVVCGLKIAQIAIDNHAPDLELEMVLNDGDAVKPKETIAILKGPAHQILVMERTCLNFMCRLSGISTLTSKFVKEVEGTNAKVLDTRKTTPGWRRLEKYAVQCGGGANHRMGLYDAVMIKDNHLAFYRSLVEDSEDTIPQAIKLSRTWIDKNKEILPNGAKTILQLEVDTLKQFEVALECKPDIVLLDNMTTEQLSAAVSRRNESAPGILLEASGGVNLNTIGNIAKTGVERISVGALTHSAVNFDIGLDWTIQ